MIPPQPAYAYDLHPDQSQTQLADQFDKYYQCRRVCSCKLYFYHNNRPGTPSRRLQSCG